MSSTSSDDSDTSEPAPAIVIDNGSYSVKCGFGGEDTPETCLVAYHDVTCEEDNTFLHENYHFMDERDVVPCVLKPGDFNKYPVIREGVVQDWDCLEALWEKFLLENKVDCSEQPVVMLSAISNNCAASTRRFCEISFEKFGFKKLCIAAPETMALVASGRDMAVVTNIGYDYCVSVPTICPLNGLKREVKREAKTEDVRIFSVKVGGRHVSEYIKHELINTHHQEDNTTLNHIVEDIKRRHCHVTPWGADPRDDDWSPEQQYTLPDNTSISLTDLARDSTEILFSTRDEDTGMNIADSLCRSVVRSSIHNQGYSSHAMWDNMVVYGGTSLIGGLQDRLHVEVRIQSDPGAKFRTVAAPERRYSPWIGASIFSSLSGFGDYGLSNLDFEEHGPDGMEIL